MLVVNVTEPRFGGHLWRAGTGTRDDTPAIQRAVNELEILGDRGWVDEYGSTLRRGTLYFPPGTYRLSEPISMTTRTRLSGAGEALTHIIGDFVGPALRWGASIINGERGWPSTHFVQCNGVTVSNPQGDGIHLACSQMSHLRNVAVTACGGRGVSIPDGGGLRVEQLWITNCVGEGFYANGAQGLYGDNIDCNFCAGSYVNGKFIASETLPQIHLKDSSSVHLDMFGTEQGRHGVLLENVIGAHIGGVTGGVSIRENRHDSTLLRITGDSDCISFGYLKADGYSTLLRDDSASAGFTRDVTVPGNPAGQARCGAYTQRTSPN